MEISCDCKNRTLLIARHVRGRSSVKPLELLDEMHLVVIAKIVELIVGAMAGKVCL